MRMRALGRLAAATAVAAAGFDPGAALGRPATASAPPQVQAYLGRHAVTDARGRRLCTATLRWEPTVGGQVEAGRCAKAAPDLSESLRFHAERGGGVVLEDALHGRRGRLDEDEAGVVGVLRGGQRVRLEPLDVAPEISPQERVRGRWRPAGRRGEPTGKGCVVDFDAGGRIAVAASCPPDWRRFEAGRWHAGPDRLRLTAPDQAARTFEFGGDPTVALAADGSGQLVRVDGWPAPAARR